MVMLGQTYKEIERKVKKCVIEDGVQPEDCVRELEKEYELEENDKLEILAIAKNVGKA